MSANTQEQEALRRFIAWGETQDSVRAMVLTSSRTSPIGVVDVFSDYDVILVVTDITPFYNSRLWLEDFGPVLVLYRDPILQDGDVEMSAYVVQFENGLKIDFTLWPVALMQRVAAEATLPAEFDAGYRILLDKDHLSDGLKPPTYKAYIPKPPSEDDYQEKIELFFLDAIYMAKFLWRDDIIAAKHMLDYFIKQDYVIPLLVWHYEIANQWSVKPGLFGRRLKRWLRPDLWDELETTYTDTGLENNWTALFRTIHLFRRVAIEVGEHLGYTYPHALDGRVDAYIQKVRKLDRQADSFSH